MKKRTLAFTLAVAVAVSVSPVTAFARGHVRRTAVQYSLCNQEDCNIMGVHKHGSVYCSGHYLGDGHDYHVACVLEGCLRVDEHEHGEFCIGAAGNGCGFYGAEYQRGCRR